MKNIVGSSFRLKLTDSSSVASGEIFNLLGNRVKDLSTTRCFSRDDDLSINLPVVADLNIL